MEVKNKQEVRLKKAHIALMKHHETALYSGVMLMGKSEVSDNLFYGIHRWCKQALLSTIPRNYHKRTQA